MSYSVLFCYLFLFYKAFVELMIQILKVLLQKLLKMTIRKCENIQMHQNSTVDFMYNITLKSFHQNFKGQNIHLAGRYFHRKCLDMDWSLPSILVFIYHCLCSHLLVVEESI